MIYSLLTAAWLLSVIVSWIYGKRKISATVAILGALAQAGIWFFGIGNAGIAALGVLTAIGMCSVPEVFLRE